MNNELIRKTMQETRTRYFELASLLNVSEQTLYRRLRKELTKEDQEALVKIIRKYAKERSV